jgi:hypothetical protein
MRNIVLPIFLTFVILITCETTSWGQMYQWVDEKGTVHLSDHAPPAPSKQQEAQPAKENTSAILKKLEVGYRQIPKDMRKYTPAQGNVERRRDSDNTNSTPSRSYRT